MGASLFHFLFLWDLLAGLFYIVVAMEALCKLGADRQKVKPLDTPGAQPPTGNAVVKCNNYSNLPSFTDHDNQSQEE